MRVGQGYITSGNKTVQISDNTSPLQEVSFLSILNKSDYTSVVIIRLSTTDTATFPDGYKHLYEFKLQPYETRTFGLEDFPSGATGATHFGGSASTNKLDIYSEDDSPHLFIFYSVYDMSNPRSLTGVQTNFVGDSGSGGAQGLVPPPGAGDAAAGKYLDSDGTWTTPPDTNTTYSAFDNDNAGLVPDPGSTGTTTKYLREDGTFQVPPDTNTTYSEATSSAEGLMSTAHHDKLDGIATGAEVNVNADWNSSSGDSEILNKPTLPAATVASGLIKWQQAKVTLSEAQLNALDATPITLIAAQGADTIIMCGDALALIDRDASAAQAQSNCDLVIGYNSTVDYNKAILYERRFMYNEGGDRTWSFKADYSGEVAASLTGAVNVPVTIGFTNACTAGSLDSMTVYIQYYVIDNS